MKENIPDEIIISNGLDARSRQLIAEADAAEWQWSCSRLFSRFFRMTGIHLIILFCTNVIAVSICFLAMFWQEVISVIGTLLVLGLFGLFLAFLGWMVGTC
ncbi:hypothetical protein QK227_002327 [Salmonella enterica]|nr:hypothetical protein [Salmonella enterica]